MENHVTLDKKLVMDCLRNNTDKPMTIEELFFKLDLTPMDSGTLDEILTELTEEGRLLLSRKGKYLLTEKMNLEPGVIQMSARGNYAFFCPLDKEKEDTFIVGRNLLGAMHGDTVLMETIKEESQGRRAEGRVFKILKRANKKIAGVIEVKNKYSFVIPQDERIVEDIYIPKKKTLGAKTGQVVLVEITKWREPGKNPEGRVVEILGHQTDPGMDMELIIRKHNLRSEFPEAVLREAERVSDTIGENELKNRLDLRDELIVTIDGEDAKDLDDAVHLKKMPNGHFELGVHIADVSHYVEAFQSLDREAKLRGTSVYLVDRVLPMLPKKLSNGICSLNPEEDRLTMSCIMEINQKGFVVNYRILPSVIHSKKRLTYTKVNDVILHGDREFYENNPALHDMLFLMADLQKILYQKRLDRGSIDFEFPEVKVILDEEGKPLEIRPFIRYIGERIIEEFMLLANETVSEHLAWLTGPNLYRVHEEPDNDSMVELNRVLHNFGYGLKGLQGDHVHPRELQKIVEDCKGKPEERLLNTLMLRSLKKARYTDEQLGHFALSVKYYTHFTSPIRRYPDLVIHRLLKMDRSEDSKLLHYYEEHLAEITDDCSERERAAEMAERESVDLKMAEFMQDKVGKVFEGTISGVTNYGFFVELQNLAEGLVRVADLYDDYYLFDEKNYLLIGERTKRQFRLGDGIKVRIKDVNLSFREINMLPVLKDVKE